MLWILRQEPMILHPLCRRLEKERPLREFGGKRRSCGNLSRIKCQSTKEYGTTWIQEPLERPYLTEQGRGSGTPSEVALPLHFDKRVARLPVEVEGYMSNESVDLPQGTLDLLILRTLALEPMHGWAISERIHQVSNEVLQVQQGSLYPALHRLERRGWIKARWGASENNRRAKYYELTRNGRKQLETEESDWKKMTAAVAQVLETS